MKSTSIQLVKFILLLARGDKWPRSNWLGNPKYLGSCPVLIRLLELIALIWKQVETMLNDIINAFGSLVDSLDWIDAATNRLIKQKSSAIRKLIGYPDWLLVPGKLSDFYRNVSLIRFQTAYWVRICIATLLPLLETTSFRVAQSDLLL